MVTTPRVTWSTGESGAALLEEPGADVPAVDEGTADDDGEGPADDGDGEEEEEEEEEEDEDEDEGSADLPEESAAEDPGDDDGNDEDAKPVADDGPAEDASDEVARADVAADDVMGPVVLVAAPLVGAVPASGRLTVTGRHIPSTHAVVRVQSNVLLQRATQFPSWTTSSS
ncbi:MAG: hypothetical protein HY904_20665 [Deltaproteobacteria bacterium]|nr:hypothetical protein [Deltaproteobacteria bacterium]